MGRSEIVASCAAGFGWLTRDFACTRGWRLLPEAMQGGRSSNAKWASNKPGRRRFGAVWLQSGTHIFMYMILRYLQDECKFHVNCIPSPRSVHMLLPVHR